MLTEINFRDADELNTQSKEKKISLSYKWRVL